MTDIIVIGCGVSGMTACLYALRAGKTVTVIESDTIGGQIALSPRVENFPAIKTATGQELSDKLFDQITALGADFEPDKALKAEKTKNGFKVTCEYGTVYEGKALIIANGAKRKHLDADGEKKLLGKGVYYCAVCDGAFYKGKEAVVIGDANSAIQYCLYLSAICKKITLLALFDKLFCDKNLKAQVEKLNNVEIIYNTKVVEFVGGDKLEKIRTENTVTGETAEVTAEAAFVAIGQLPQNEAFTNLADLDEKGYFNADESLETKTAGVFVAGDTRRKPVRQLTTACSDGSVAATKACAYVDSLN